MNELISSFLVAHGNVGSRQALVDLVGRISFDAEVRRGHLVRVFPRAYVRPWDGDDITLRRRAALISVGGRAGLSHRTALRQWDLPCPGFEAVVDLSVPWSRNPSPSAPGLRVHHIKEPFPEIVLVHGLPTVSCASAITTSWPYLRASDQRAPFLAARRDKLVTPADVRRELRRSTRIRGRRQLLELADLIDAGCESELEIWGYLDVFDIPELAHANRQRVIEVDDHTYRLDLAYEAERLAVELDGRKFHASPEQWERDIARDLALATVGWQTIRLSHNRLTRDPAGCRRKVLNVLAARRQMHLSS